MSVDYDPVTLLQTVYTPAGEEAGGARQVALRVKYKESVKPGTWSPAGLPQMFVSYDGSVGPLRARGRAGGFGNGVLLCWVVQ